MGMRALWRQDQQLGMALEVEQEKKDKLEKINAMESGTLYEN